MDGMDAIKLHTQWMGQVYKEILRVLKPGGTFACYEWCLTDEYDAQDAAHRKIKKDIEVAWFIRKAGGGGA